MSDEEYNVVAMREYWDGRALKDAKRNIVSDDRWDSESDFDQTGAIDAELILSSIEPFLENKKKVSVLDIGCGIGRIAKWIALKHPNWEVVGVDISPEMIAQGFDWTKNVPNLKLQAYPGDLFYLFDPNKFDFIYSYIVLQHLPREYVKELMGQIGKLLKPLGYFFFQMQAPRGDYGQIMEGPKTGTYRQVRCYSREDIMALCDSAGLDIVVMHDLKFSDLYTLTLAQRPKK